MDLIEKAFALCAEIEERQKELRELLGIMAEEQAETEISAAPDLKKEEDIQPSVVADEEPSASQPLADDCESEAIFSEIITTPSLEKPVSVGELRKAFTINDRFRFRRELFGGNDREFVALIDRLSGMSSFDEAEQCIYNVVADRDADVVAEFKSIVSTFFNGYHL